MIGHDDDYVDAFPPPPPLTPRTLSFTVYGSSAEEYYNVWLAMTMIMVDADGGVFFAVVVLFHCQGTVVYF